MATRRRGSLRLAGLGLAAALALSGCGAVQKLSAPPEPAGSAPAPATASPSASTRTTPRPARTVPAWQRNDLRTGQVQRSFRSGALMVNVQYSSPLAIDRWTPAVTKPLAVSVTAFVHGRRARKTYLFRVRADLAVCDGSGPLAAPAALDDTSNLAPGYIVTFPPSTPRCSRCRWSTAARPRSRST